MIEKDSDEEGDEEDAFKEEIDASYDKALGKGG